MTCTIKDSFKETADTIKLPIYVKRVNDKSTSEQENAYVPLTKTMLTEDFELEKSDLNIDFDSIMQLDEIVDYKLVAKKIDSQFSSTTKEDIENKRIQLAAKIAKHLKFDDVYEPHITIYINQVLEEQSEDRLIKLIDKHLQTEQAFKTKIDSLITDYQKKMFKHLLDTGQIKCLPYYSFVQSFALKHKCAGLSKGLYTEEGDMNDFEYNVIAQVANLDNVLFWHRNPEHSKGFFINGFINHYPDFIVRMKNGITVLLETKSDERDNSDCLNKIELGKAWATHAGINDFRYFMVYDKTRFDNAIAIEELVNCLQKMY